MSAPEANMPMDWTAHSAENVYAYEECADVSNEEEAKHIQTLEPVNLDYSKMKSNDNHDMEVSENFPIKRELQNTDIKEEYSNQIYGENDPNKVPERESSNFVQCKEESSEEEENGKEKRRYGCPKCNRTFKAEYRVAQHILCSHSKKKEKLLTEKRTKCATAWPCHLCSRSFMDKMNLNRHLCTTHSDLTPYPCEGCTRLFKLKQYLLKHFTAAHCNYESLNCEICDRQFDTDKNLTEHVRKVHCKRDPNIPEIDLDTMCESVSTSADPAFKKTPADPARVKKKRGRKKEKEEKKKEKKGRKRKILDQESSPVAIKESKKEESSSSSAIKESRKEGSFNPAIKETRKDVLSSYSVQKIWTCAICDRIFTLGKKVEEHLIAAHFDDNPDAPGLDNYYNVQTKFKCELCDIPLFGQKMNLDRHLLTTHCKETPFPCVVCERKFKLRQYIKKHFLAHHCDNIHFFCEKCEIKFEDFNELTDHVVKNHCARKVAKRTKPKLPKGVSNKSGTDSDDVFKPKKHSKRFGENVKWTCRECGGDYSSKVNLDRHLITVHCDERPIKCPECSRGFKLLEYVRKHYISQHCVFSSMYCRKCDVTFQYKSMLLKHVYQVHCPSPTQLRSTSSSDSDEFPENLPSQCSFCNQSFPRYKELIRHARRCEKYRLFAREENEKALPVQTESGTREYGCMLCPDVSQKSQVFADHLKSTHDVNFFIHMCRKTRCHRKSRFY